jgi:hypothetical protein
MELADFFYFTTKGLACPHFKAKEKAEIEITDATGTT